MNMSRCIVEIGWTLVACASAFAQQTTRMSVDSSGAEGDGNSYGWAISADGRYVVFQSFASNLVANDWNHREDIFVHDRVLGTTERVSVSSSGKQANDDSYYQAISADGRFVAFFSWADNLVVGDTNGTGDIFLHDRVTGDTELISVDQNGGPTDGPSFAPSISADGRFVAFYSLASDIVAGDTNGNYDVFVRDRQLGVTELVSVDSSGIQGNGGSAGPSISADGGIVAFHSESTNLVAGDSNARWDAFVRDRSNGTTTRVSVDSIGSEANGDSDFAAISADGQVVSFESWATNLTTISDGNGVRDLFVHDCRSGLTECVSLNASGVTGNDESRAPPGVSTDGRFIAFVSHASDLVSNDTNDYEDVFVRDRITGTTERVSVDFAGNEADQGAGGVGISGNGECVVFFSGSPLVSNDTNNFGDAFVRDRCDALWLEYGAGFSGTNGIPGFTSQSDPVIGSKVSLDLENSSGAATFGLLFLGFQRADIPTSWGGDLLVLPTVTLPLMLLPGITTLVGAIPNDPSLCQVALDLQAFEADGGAAKRVACTRGLELILGY
jgi:hypothetical protein